MIAMTTASAERSRGAWEREITDSNCTGSFVSQTCRKVRDKDEAPVVVCSHYLLVFEITKFTVLG